MKYANLGTTELRELQLLRDESAKLMRLVADLTLDKHILEEIVKNEDSILTCEITRPELTVIENTLHWNFGRFQ